MPQRVLLLAGVAVVTLAGLRLWPQAPLRDRIPLSTVVFDRRDEALRVTLADDGQLRLWTPLNELPPALVEAVLLHEDQHFWWHPGINPVALLRAAIATGTGGARQGASTITMQLARLQAGHNTRSVGAKLRQMFAALWLEARYSKREILEAYLNLTPYGGNVQGVGAAARLGFDKRPDQLDLAQTLALAVMPQAPEARAPRAQESAGLHAARLRLFARWLARHPEDARQQALVESPLQFGRRPAPFEAPHFTTMALRRSAADGNAARALHTTLDLRLQTLLERRLHDHLLPLAREGVVNASALLVDTRDMSVRAWIGSAGYDNAAIAGQVDGVLARRSPGSTLKPMLYALAMDQGLIHPLTVLKDAPTWFGPYAPENADGHFLGPITAHDALIRSRNVPAVQLSARLGDPTLYRFLKSADVALPMSEQHYGLALTLGGGEVSMVELAQLYAMLANRGVWKPLRWLAEAPADEGRRLLSEDASFMVLDILRDNPRPDDAIAQPARRALIPAWKTGTSWGFRDAWTAGVLGPYVLVVWVGNFDGQGNPAFVGVQTAAPLFFDLLDALRAAGSLPAVPQYRTHAAAAREGRGLCRERRPAERRLPAAHEDLVHSRRLADPHQQRAPARVHRHAQRPAGLSAVRSGDDAQRGLRILAVRSAEAVRAGRHSAARAAVRCLRPRRRAARQATGDHVAAGRGDLSFSNGLRRPPGAGRRRSRPAATAAGERRWRRGRTVLVRRRWLCRQRATRHRAAVVAAWQRQSSRAGRRRSRPRRQPRAALGGDALDHISRGNGHRTARCIHGCTRGVSQKIGKVPYKTGESTMVDTARQGWQVLALTLNLLLLSACADSSSGAVTLPVVGDIVEVPVSFRVQNSNRSQVSCTSDGLSYEIRGHLVGPRSLLDAATPQAVTLYLHGIGWGEYYWHFKSVPGYDHLTEMARLNHVSVAFEQLGYGDSGRPLGSQSCYGSEADTASQIVAQLRAGTYTATGRPAPRFQRVALASHVTGALMTEPEAISFADVDALVVTSWADSSFSPAILAANVQIVTACAGGGEPSEGSSGPGGYTHTPIAEADFRSIYFFNADPAVIDAAAAQRHRGPCGEPMSAVPALGIDLAMANRITVPVLLVYGDRDGFFANTTVAGQLQAALFTGSRDVRMEILPNTGNALTLERSAPAFRQLLSTWLAARGF
ncbi:MAG: hypothetical protein NVS9B10_18630 [Nevskia sp.]